MIFGDKANAFWLTHLYDGWVQFTTFLEFVECEFSIFVKIHVSEDLVHTLDVSVKVLRATKNDRDRCSSFFQARIAVTVNKTHLLWGILIFW